MKVTLWGVRAQTATPGDAYKKYGGNTLSVEIRDSDNNLLIIDLGTGARLMGSSLFNQEKKYAQYNILISSVQYDRILGLPFFVPILFIPTFNINIYGPISSDKNLFKKRISESMSYNYFPVRMDELKAEFKFIEIPEKKVIQIGGYEVEAFKTKYVTDCYAYKVKSDRKTLVYISSNEDSTKDDNGLTEFCRNADILLHDSYFWNEKNMKGWGRSSFRKAMLRGYQAGVKKLILYGLNPQHTDKMLDKALERLKIYDQNKGYNLDFTIGKELDTYEI
jgi:ribonuclease BN (tRNA processing enzyme)